MLRITKDTLRQLNVAAGKLNTDSGEVFLGFVGRLEMSDRLYHGELRFEVAGDDPPEDTVSIQAILDSATGETENGDSQNQAWD